jgi:hypothetical protein
LIFVSFRNDAIIVFHIRAINRASYIEFLIHVVGEHPPGHNWAMVADDEQSSEDNNPVHGAMGPPSPAAAALAAIAQMDTDDESSEPEAQEESDESKDLVVYFLMYYSYHYLYIFYN